MTRLPALFLAAPLALFWALPVTAGSLASDDEVWECQSCAARHQSLQALQQSRRVRNQSDCTRGEADTAGAEDCPEPPAEDPDMAKGLRPPPESE